MDTQKQHTTNASIVHSVSQKKEDDDMALEDSSCNMKKQRVILERSDSDRTMSSKVRKKKMIKKKTQPTGPNDCSEPKEPKPIDLTDLVEKNHDIEEDQVTLPTVASEPTVTPKSDKIKKVSKQSESGCKEDVDKAPVPTVASEPTATPKSNKFKKVTKKSNNEGGQDVEEAAVAPTDSTSSEPIMETPPPRTFVKITKKKKKTNKHGETPSTNDLPTGSNHSAGKTLPNGSNHSAGSTGTTTKRKKIRWHKNSSFKQICPILSLEEYTQEEIVAVWGDETERRQQEDDMDKELKAFVKMGRRISDNASCTSVGITPIIDEERRRHRLEVKEEAYHSVLWEQHYIFEEEEKSGIPIRYKDMRLANVYHDVAHRALVRAQDEANRLSLDIQIFSAPIYEDDHLTKPSAVVKEENIKKMKSKKNLLAAPVHGITKTVVGGSKLVNNGLNKVSKTSLKVTKQGLHGLNSVSKTSMNVLGHTVTGITGNVLDGGKVVLGGCQQATRHSVNVLGHTVTGITGNVLDGGKVVLGGCQQVTRHSVSGIVSIGSNMSDITGKVVKGSGRAVMKSCTAIPRRVGSISIIPKAPSSPETDDLKSDNHFPPIGMDGPLRIGDLKQMQALLR